MVSSMCWKTHSKTWWRALPWAADVAQVEFGNSVELFVHQRHSEAIERGGCEVRLLDSGV